MRNRRTAQARLNEVTKEIQQLKSDIQASQRRLSNLETEQKNLVTELAPKPTTGISVSDHAVLRYLESRFSLDLDAIRDEILTDDRRTAIQEGATKITAGGIAFVIQDNTVVTALGRR